MDTARVHLAIERITESICSEFFSGGVITPVAFLGIQIGGVPLARRIAGLIEQRFSYRAPLGMLDIAMYRDDIGTRKTLPVIHETVIDFDLNNREVILVDDILQTGRSIRAALDAITDYGRPSCIRLAVLVDRGMREFPIRPDYVGELLEAPANERMNAEWSEYQQQDAVYAVPRKESNNR